MKIKRHFKTGKKYYLFTDNRHFVWGEKVYNSLQLCTITKTKRGPWDPDDYFVHYRNDVTGENDFFYVEPRGEYTTESVNAEWYMFPTKDLFLKYLVNSLDIINHVTSLQTRPDGVKKRFCRFDKFLTQKIKDSQEKHPEIWI